MNIDLYASVHISSDGGKKPSSDSPLKKEKSDSSPGPMTSVTLRSPKDYAPTIAHALTK